MPTRQVVCKANRLTLQFPAEASVFRQRFADQRRASRWEEAIVCSSVMLSLRLLDAEQLPNIGLGGYSHASSGPGPLIQCTQIQTESKKEATLRIPCYPTSSIEDLNAREESLVEYDEGKKIHER